MGKLKRNLSSIVHYNMSLIGGFFGGYAICNLCDVLGNAQTHNLISIVYDIFMGDFLKIAARIIGVLIYFVGLALTVIMPRYTKLRCDYLSLVIDVICLIILAFMPENWSVMIHIYPIFFAMSFQWAAFNKIEGYVSSTIFSTNNFRQFSTSLVEYMCDKDKSQLKKAKLFGFTLLSFHIGVALACAGSIFMDSVSALLGIVPIIPAIVLNIKKNKKQ